jgi:hypothetical protein
MEFEIFSMVLDGVLSLAGSLSSPFDSIVGAEGYTSVHASSHCNTASSVEFM